MKIRTVYFKVSQLKNVVSFWQAFLEVKPHKNTKAWAEFRCGDLNFALLAMPGFAIPPDGANFVPVFEFADKALEDAKTRALGLGARIVVDVADHPDRMSYVLVDPFGNEFEITRFHD